VLSLRQIGDVVGGITVNPDAVRGYEGLCWGVDHTEAFAEGRGDASDFREALASEMPQAGEDRRPVADVFGNVYAQCIELMAGRAAEAIFLDGEPVVPADDLRQARELAMLICSSEEAIETFIAHCDVAARDLLMPLRRCRDRAFHGASHQAHPRWRRDRQDHLGPAGGEGAGDRASPPRRLAQPRADCQAL
jgi:hypothetical protein